MRVLPAFALSLSLLLLVVSAASATEAPCTGYTKALVVLVKFPNDTTDHEHRCWWGPYNWPDSLEHRLPFWARGDSLMDADTTSANFIEGSLSDYWSTMSLGSYCFYGDVYDTVVCPPENSTWYTNQYGAGDYGYANYDILTYIDDSVDFSEYDANPKDGVVDAIQICYRWSTFLACGVGRSTLAPRGDFGDWPIVTNDSTWDASEECSVAVEIRNGWYCPDGDTIIGSGTTQTVNNRLVTLQTAGHEWAHYLYMSGLGHGGHMPGGRWGMFNTSSGIGMNAFSRWLLGWVTPTEYTLGSSSCIDTLSDALSTGDIIKVVADTTSPDTCRSFYLIENRQPVTFYDQKHPLDHEDCRPEIPGYGLLVFEVNYNYADDLCWWARLKCANGQYKPPPGARTGEPDGIVGEGDIEIGSHANYGKGSAGNAFNENNNNTFAPYTVPSTYPKVCDNPPCTAVSWGDFYTDYDHSGFAMCNVHSDQSDTTQMIVDLYFGMPEDTVTVATEWSGRIILDRDVAVSSTLTINPGTEVWFADNYDYMESGQDNSKGELITADGGDMQIVGSSTDGIALVPDSTDAWSAGDWYGVVADGGKMTLESCDIGYATNGIRADTDSTVTLDDCRIHNNSSAGIWIHDADLEVEASTIDSNTTYGMYVGTTGGVKVRRSTFADQSLHVRAADADLDLGDMSTPGPGNAGWNAFTGGDTCVSNTDADTVLAQGNYWGSDDASTVASRMSGPVNYSPWLPVPPSSIDPEDSYAMVVDSEGDELDFVRGLAPLGDGNDFILRFVVFDLSDTPVEDLDPQFLYAVVESDTAGPSCECGGCKGYYSPSSACVAAPYLFYCQPSNDTLFATDATDSEGISEMIDDQVGGAARLELKGYVGPLAIGDSDTAWINSGDIVPCPDHDGVVGGGDFSEFAKHYGDTAWFVDFVPDSTCTVGPHVYPAYNVDASDFSWFGDYYDADSTCSCD